MEYPPTLQSYVAALAKYGADFEHKKWYHGIKKVRAVGDRPGSQEHASEPGDRISASELRPEVEVRLAAAGRTPARAASKSAGPAGKSSRRPNSIARTFGRICVAWDDLQENRRRDAVYDFLARVFYAVKKYRARRRLNRLIRYAQVASGRPECSSADPYADLIRAASEGAVGRKLISKYSRALRHARRHKSRDQTLKAFIGGCGGLNACAALYADRKRR